MKIGELIVKIGADASQFVRTLDATKKQVQTTAAAMTSFGRTASLAVTLPMVAAAGAALKMSASMEQTRIAMTTMTGSATEAAHMLAQVRKMALETPYGLQELTTATRQLMTYEFQGQKAISMLHTVGDATAALGQGSFGMERIIRALGQMQAKGRVMAQEMNQLAEVGISGWRMISDATGMSVAQLQKATEQGMVNATVGIEAILKGMSQRFGGAMAAQQNTIAGQWERFVDQGKESMRLFGDAVLPIARGVLRSLSEILEGVSKKFAAMSVSERNSTIAIYAVTAALPPLIFLIGKVVTAIIALKAAERGSLILGGVVGIAVAAAAVALGIIVKRWLDYKSAMAAINIESTAFTSGLARMTEAEVRLAHAAAFRAKAQTDAALEMARTRQAQSSGYQSIGEGGSLYIDPDMKRRYDAAGEEIRRLETLKKQRDAALIAANREIGQRFVAGFGAGGSAMSAIAGAGGGAAGDAYDVDATMNRLQRQVDDVIAAQRQRNILASRYSTISPDNAFRTGYENGALSTPETVADQASVAQERFDSYVSSFTDWSNGFLEIGDRMGNVAASIAMNWQSAGQIIQNVLQGMVAQLLAAITKALVFKGLMTMFGIPMGGGKGGGLSVGGIIKGAFGFAEGGIVTKPTLAMIGEKREPEAVIPLSKMGNMGGRQTINIVLDGQVIASAVANRNAKEVRLRGVLAA